MTRPAREAWLREAVHVSAALSCGCRFRKSEPVPMLEANAWPGTVVICDRHDEYAVVIRVSTFLADQQQAVLRLLIADGMSPDDASTVRTTADMADDKAATS